MLFCRIFEIEISYEGKRFHCYPSYIAQISQNFQKKRSKLSKQVFFIPSHVIGDYDRENLFYKMMLSLEQFLYTLKDFLCTRYNFKFLFSLQRLFGSTLLLNFLNHFSHVISFIYKNRKVIKPVLNIITICYARIIFKSKINYIKYQS